MTVLCSNPFQSVVPGWSWLCHLSYHLLSSHVSTMLSSLVFLKHATPSPGPGPLLLPFALPGQLLSPKPNYLSPTIFKFFLNGHFLQRIIPLPLFNTAAPTSIWFPLSDLSFLVPLEWTAIFVKYIMYSSSPATR